MVKIRKRDISYTITVDGNYICSYRKENQG